jgi:hypothetical protein
VSVGGHGTGQCGVYQLSGNVPFHAGLHAILWIAALDFADSDE